MMRREWKVKRNPFMENESLHDASFDGRSPDDTDVEVVHVRELLPGDVLLSAEEFARVDEKIADVITTLLENGTPYNAEELELLLEVSRILDAAKGRKL